MRQSCERSVHGYSRPVDLREHASTSTRGAVGCSGVRRFDRADRQRRRAQRHLTRRRKCYCIARGHGAVRGRDDCLENTLVPRGRGARHRRALEPMHRTSSRTQLNISFEHRVDLARGELCNVERDPPNERSWGVILKVAQAASGAGRHHISKYRLLEHVLQWLPPPAENLAWHRWVPILDTAPATRWLRQENQEQRFHVEKKAEASAED